MTYNTCYAPYKCDCSECKEKAFRWVKKSKRKPLTRMSRMSMIRNYYSDVQTEYHEVNNPNHIYEMFSEMLSTIPKDVLISCETLGLFINALEDTIGKEEAKSKNKVYI